MNAMKSEVHSWMAWEGGVDLVALSSHEARQPDVIVHVARVVHTPRGSAAAGLILLPDFDDLKSPPQLSAFVCEDENIGAYFGAQIFAGTPFENAPCQLARIEIDNNENSAVGRIQVGALSVEVHLHELGIKKRVQREPESLPFFQSGVERQAGRVELVVDGTKREIVVPAVGISGGPAAVFSPCGLYLALNVAKN